MSPTREELALLDVDAVLGRAAASLAQKYARIFSAETVERYVHESYVALFRTARIHSHLPALAEHWPSPAVRSTSRCPRCCSCVSRTPAAPR